MSVQVQLCKRIFVLASLIVVCEFAGTVMAADKLIVMDSAGTQNKFVVTDTGRVGISNASVPITDAGIYVKGSTYPDNTIKVEGTGGGGFIAYTPYTALSFPTTGARLGFQYFGAVNSSVSPSTVLHATGFFAGAESNWTASSTPAYFAFETTPASSTTRVERMRISSNGNVGIGTGTGTPTQKLEIKDGGIRLNNGAAQPTCDNTNAPNVRGLIWFVKGGTGVADSLQICTRDGANYAWRTINLQ